MDFATPRISKSVEGSYKQNQEKKTLGNLDGTINVNFGIPSTGAPRCIIKWKTILTACYFQSYFTNLDCFLKEDPPVPNYLLRVRSCEVGFFTKYHLRYLVKS